MKGEQYYSIGQTSKMCDVSPRMLRYYEEIGLIKPDKISEESRYRYYSVNTMRNVQTIRYLVEQGFSLERIKQAFGDGDLNYLRDMFLEKIKETEENIKREYKRLDSLRSWCAEIIEGKEILRHPVFAPAVRYVPEELYFYYERERRPEETEASDVYIETEYYTKSKEDGHSMIDVGGAFYLYYDSCHERIDNTFTKQTLLQILYKNSSLENTTPFGGFNAVCAFHIGSTDTIKETYEGLLAWAEEHHFPLRGDCLERHVLDIYSTPDPNQFVTEVILPLAEDTDNIAIMDDWK